MNNIEVLITAINNFVIKDKRERYIGFISSKKKVKFYNDLCHKFENYICKSHQCLKSDIQYTKNWIIAGNKTIIESKEKIDDIISNCEFHDGGYFLTNNTGRIAVYISTRPSKIHI